MLLQALDGTFELPGGPGKMLLAVFICYWSGLSIVRTGGPAAWLPTRAADLLPSDRKSGGYTVRDAQQSLALRQRRPYGYDSGPAQRHNGRDTLSEAEQEEAPAASRSPSKRASNP